MGSAAGRVSPQGFGVREETLVPGRHRALLSSTKLRLPWGDGEGPCWPTQRPRAKRHIPRAVAKEVDGPKLAGRGGGKTTRPPMRDDSPTQARAGGRRGPPLAPRYSSPTPGLTPAHATSGMQREREAHLPLRPGARG